MSDRETRRLTCPSCGAPYRKLIPTTARQARCDYCGTVFEIQAKVGVDVPSCLNHPERFATGICNDCGQRFCDECLQPYQFATENERILLHLCSACRRKRDYKTAETEILLGVLFLTFGIISLFLLWPLGALLFLIALGLVIHGYNKIPKEAKSMTERIDDAEEWTRPKAEAEESEDAERTLMQYEELLTKYADHWGIRTGAELLDNEIRAYTWHEEKYSEAVKRVYERNKGKPV